MSIGEYQAGLRSAVYGFWRGVFDYYQFVDAMAVAVERGMTQAFDEGAAECGILPEDRTFSEKMALRQAILEQKMWIDKLAVHVEQHTKKLGGKRGPLYTRLEVWVQRYNEVRERSKSLACADVKAVWVYGDTVAHCLPGNAMILTSEGEKRIDGVFPGDYVLTRDGWQVVKEVFKHEYDGPIITIEVGGRSLMATSDHLIMTQRGWIRASELIAGQDTVFFQDGLDNSWIHITAPNSFHDIATSCKIGISRIVASLLGLLAFRERFKTWMTMPIVTIGFDNQVSNLNIDDELIFDRDLSAIAYAKRIKNSIQLSFQPTRVLSLVGAAGKCRNAPGFVWMSFPPPADRFCITRVIFKHPVLRSLCLASSSFSFRETWAISRDYACSRRDCAAYNISNFFRDVSQIKFTDAVNLFFRGCVPVPTLLKPFAVQLRSALTRARLFANRVSTGIIVNNPRLEHSVTDRTLNIIEGSGFVTTGRATKSLRWWYVSVKRLVATLTDKIMRLAHHIAPLYHPTAIISQSVENASLTVYNLEIDGLPEFFANGILVHNCDDCSRAVGRVYRISVWDRYGWVPGSHELACGGWRCDCGRVPTSAPVTPGRPPALVGRG